LAQGNIQELKRVHEQCFEVRLKGDLAPFAGRLAAAGCSTEFSDDVLRVRLPVGESPQLVWRAAAEQQEQIRHLRAQRSTLEDVFLSAVEAS
jgi:ABC-2 type transport system ATP-binding protein